MEKFVSQDMKCFYTGTDIVIGGNASMDHLIPVAKGGTGEMANLNWVTWEVNRSKNDMTHDEFVAMCHKVARRFPLKQEPRSSSSAD